MYSLNNLFFYVGPNKLFMWSNEFITNYCDGYVAQCNTLNFVLGPTANHLS